MTIMIFTMLMLMMVMMLNKHLLTRRRVTNEQGKIELLSQSTVDG